MNKLKALFQGPYGKYMIAGVGVVALLGLWAAKRNSSSDSGAVGLEAYPTYQGNTTSSDNATASDGVTQTEVTELVNSLNSSYQTSLRDTQNIIASALYTQQQQLTGLQTQFTTNLDSYKQEVNQKLLSSAQTSIGSSYQAPLIDHTDTRVYSSSTPYTGNAAVQSYQPKYGYGGGDYNTMSDAGKKAIEANEQKLKTDKSFVSSEATRTDKVIQERKAAGLDTKEQEAYKAKLATMQKAG